MRFWDELANGKEVEHARALLYRILRNLIIDWYRKIKSVSLDERLERGSIVEPTSDDCEKIIQGAEINQVRKVLNDLEPTYREVVVLRYVDGLDPQEISEILGETANAVSTRLTRAVQKLRELMHYQV
jgi:RNA polymerase sigma-70 factor (ECF subfamily)